MNKFALGLVLIIVALGLSVTFTQSNLSSLSDLRSEIQSYNKALAQAKELSQIESRLVEKYNSISVEDRDRIQKFLPQNIDTVRLTIEVDSIARNAGVDISGLSFVTNENNEEEIDEFDGLGEGGLSTPGDNLGVDRSNQDYSSVDMSFSVTGTYQNLNNFLESLENNLRLTDIRGISINPGSVDGNLSYSLIIRTYWLGT